MEDKYNVVSTDKSVDYSAHFNKPKVERVINPIVFNKTDSLFAFLYLIVGFCFIYTFTSGFLDRYIGVFTIIYAATVLVYLHKRKITLTKESYFWLVILLGIGVPYGFYNVMGEFQTLVLMAVAAYFTLTATGNLIEEGKSSQWVIADGLNALLVVPFCNFGCQAYIIKASLHKSKFGKTLMAIGLGLCIAVPILVIALPLLAKADVGFAEMIREIWAYLYKYLFENVVRIIMSLPVSAYLFGLVYGGLSHRNTERFHKDDIRKSLEKAHCVPDIAVNTAIFIVCSIYVLFIGLQGTYLFSAFTGITPDNFTFAEYARQGFFELCQIAVLNVIIILGANAFSKTKRCDSNLLKWMNVLLSVLTLLLIITAMSKMGLYIFSYGFTVKRVLTSVFMVWLFSIFSLSIVWKWKQIPIIKYALFIGVVLFCGLCILPIEYMI